MKAIIIDDEPKAIELMESYLKHFSMIEIEATFRNGLKAFEFLSTHAIDLVFLDINMPHLSGISLSKMINPGTRIIFTTAYAEFAAESYEVQAVDYLLKPISFERFTKAMGKILNKDDNKQNDSKNTILIKSGVRIYRVNPEDILFLHKEGNYMTYRMKSKKILARESIAEAIQSLPDYFIQIHKSYIVNIRQIDFYDKEEISVNGEVLPLGDAFKIDFIRRCQ